MLLNLFLDFLNNDWYLGLKYFLNNRDFWNRYDHLYDFLNNRDFLNFLNNRD